MAQQRGILSLRLSFHVKLELMAGVERSPSLRVFLSENVSSDVQFIDLAKLAPKSLADGTDLYEGDIDTEVFFTLHRVNTSSKVAVSTLQMIGARYMPPAGLNGVQRIDFEKRATSTDAEYETAIQNMGEASLMVCAYTRVTNEHDEVCTQRAGSARVALAHLLPSPGILKTVMGAGRTLTTPIQFHMLTPAICGDRIEPSEYTLPEEKEDFADKGSVTFQLAKCEATYLGRNVTDIVRHWKASTEYEITSPMEAHIRHAEDTMGPNGMKTRWRSIMYANIFVFSSPAGITPCEFYVDRPYGNTKEAYFLHAARLALRRMEIHEDEATAWRLGTNKHHGDMAANLLASTLSMYVNWCNYVGDKVFVKDRTVRRDPKTKCKHRVWKEKDVEAFGDVRESDSCADCEDDAAEIQVEANELKRLVSSHPLIRLLQRALEPFHVFMTLAGVKSVEINLESAAAELYSHMHAVLINRAWFEKCARRSGNTDAYIGKRLTASEYLAYSHFPLCKVMEGTGILDPDGSSNKSDPEGERLGAQIFGTPYLKKRVRPVFYYSTEGGTSFYKTAQVWLCDENLKEQGHGVAAWTLATLDAGTTDQYTAGVTFDDIASASDKIIALPRPAFTKEQVERMRHRQLVLHPIRDLHAPDESLPPPVEVATARAQMREFIALCQEKVERSGSVSTNGAISFIIAAKYIHFDQRRLFINDMMLQFRNVSKKLVAFKILEERAEAVGGFFMKFWYK